MKPLVIVGLGLCIAGTLGIVVYREFLISDLVFIGGVAVLAYSLPSKKIAPKPAEDKIEDDTGINFEQIEKNINHMNKILWGERK